MSCSSCGLGNQIVFSAEMIVHLVGLKNLDNPGLWLFPKLLVCLDCGNARFNISKTDLASLVGGTPRIEPLTMAAD